MEASPKLRESGEAAAAAAAAAEVACCPCCLWLAGLAGLEEGADLSPPPCEAVQARRLPVAQTCGHAAHSPPGHLNAIKPCRRTNSSSASRGTAATMAMAWHCVPLGSLTRTALASPSSASKPQPSAPAPAVFAAACGVSSCPLEAQHCSKPARATRGGPSGQLPAHPPLPHTWAARARAGGARLLSQVAQAIRAQLGLDRVLHIVLELLEPVAQGAEADLGEVPAPEHAALELRRAAVCGC